MSDDGILRTLAKKELIEALRVTNNHQLEITCYCLAWHCYNEIYQPIQINQNQLAPPTREQLQQIAERYNQRQQEFKISKTIHLDDIQVILKTCVQVVRTYRSSDSFTVRSQNDSSNLMTEPLNVMMQEEETLMQNEEMSQVRSIVATAFAELPDVAQKTLKLWFGLGLTQSNILILLDQVLGLQQQYQVSRRINQYKKSLTKALFKHC